MKPPIFKTIRSLFVLSISVLALSFVQENNSVTPFEKIYTHTDRPIYFPGETIWFKSYIVNSFNQPSNISDIMYADLISPKGAVVKTLQLDIEHGYAYGDFKIQQHWVGGLYTLKMHTNWMRNFDDDLFFTKKLNLQKVVKPNLLMKLEFEKEGYGAASQVKAICNFKDLKNKALGNKNIRYEVKINGVVFLNKTMETSSDGDASPTFTLPDSLNSTDVVLNVLIPHKGTTESISRSVPILLNKVDLQFFPESGKLIYEVPTIVALKSVNEFGKPADVSGVIVDELGTTITTFQSYHDGMGGFSMAPKTGKNYYALIQKPFRSKKRIPLPIIYKNGVSFSAEHAGDEVTLNIHNLSKNQLSLKVTNASGSLLKKVLQKDQKKIVINAKDFSIGVTKFSLLDTKGHILAERLIFLHPTKLLKIDIDLKKTIYETREEVIVSLYTSDKNNNPIPANLSLAIADNKLLSLADDKQDHIISHLLLSSELKGKIHEPMFYFDETEPKATKGIDYLMLTHGWRNYTLNNNLGFENAEFKPERHTTQSGSILNKQGYPEQAHLLLFDQNGGKVRVFDTTEKGEFHFKIKPGTTYTLLAYTDNNKDLIIYKNGQQNVRGINANNEISSILLEQGVIENPNINTKPLQQSIKEEVKRNQKSTTAASALLIEDSEALEEVVVLGYGTMVKRDLSGSVAVVSSEDILPGTEIESVLAGQVAGVTITNASSIYGSTAQVRVRGTASLSGNNQPLFVIDGVPMNNATIQNTGIAEINPSDIEIITVLKDMAATTLYGSRGSNGVIVINTKNNGSINNYGKKRLNNAAYNNYVVQTFYGNNGKATYSSKQFYMPKYGKKQEASERTDFRNTIYWNPIIQTDKNGKASFIFYNSDAISSFKIIAEGIGYNGIVGRKEKEYSTRKILNMDFKTPNYLTLNDTVVVPVIINNESSKLIKGSLTLSLPKSIVLAKEFDTEITIAPNASTIKNMIVIPKQKDKNALIDIKIETENFVDQVKKEVDLISPYFPTEVAISGIKNQTFEFNINNAVDHSLTAEFNIYTDIVGDVMNGIEGLIRKPSGCFEQVSSSTYPNILILKYLQETGKSNPEIEKRALAYIKEGYKKLAAYETKEDGFEWYGDTPPHEALSAYGLMQFKEMKEVYGGVDNKMIARTINWLLSRRNGEGGFKQNSGKYGFSAAPEDVNNAYIVYALSESDIGVDFKKEYQYAYKDALKTKDSYKMALLALASHNLGEIENERVLIKAMIENIEDFGFSRLPVSNTITRSYGNAQIIETLAFTLLALIQDDEKHLTFITKGVEQLVGYRAHGRFGSTQSTSMALKALIAYNRSYRSALTKENKAITLIVNGATLSHTLEMTSSGRIHIKGLEKYLSTGEQKVEVVYKDQKTAFPYTMNISWDSSLPNSSENCKVVLTTKIFDKEVNVGDNTRMQVQVKNTTNTGIPMTTAIVGIPSGTSVQTWQLKELLEEKKVAFYEIFDNYMVFYWREIGPNSGQIINLDLKAEIPGYYTAPPSTVYLYYSDEDRHWSKGNTIRINN